MPKFETVKAGDVLYDVHRVKMGNTTMSRLGCWTVNVVSIDHEKGTAQCRWNGNPPTTYYRRNIERLRRSKPKPKPKTPTASDSARGDGENNGGQR